jgi:kelch-like protein 30
VRLSDITLISGNKRLPCHKILLGVNSDYFKKMFSQFLEKEKSEVEIKEIDPKLFEKVLMSIYDPEISIVSEDEFFDILRAADMFDFKMLIEILLETMTNFVNYENLGDCLAWGQHFKILGAHAASAKFFGHVVWKLEEWGFLTNKDGEEALLPYLKYFAHAINLPRKKYSYKIQ